MTLLRETIQGYVGKRIRDDLLEVAGALDAAATRSVRNGKEPLDECRYKLGVADGVRIALTHVMELGQDGS